MPAIILFIGSTVLIIAFLMLKRVEFRRELRFFEASRSALDTRVKEGTFFTTHILPKKVVHHVVEFATNAAHILTLMLLRGLRVAEQKLLGVSNAVKGKREVHRRKASTSYLEDVSNHKKQIITDRQNGDLKSE